MKIEIEPHDLMVVFAALKYIRLHRQDACSDLTTEYFNSAYPLERQIDNILRIYLKENPEHVEVIKFMQEHNLLDSKRPIKLLAEVNKPI